MLIILYMVNRSELPFVGVASLGLSCDDALHFSCWHIEWALSPLALLLLRLLLEHLGLIFEGWEDERDHRGPGVSRSQRVQLWIHWPNVALLLLEVRSELLFGDALSKLETLGDLVERVTLFLLIELWVLLQQLVLLNLSLSNVKSIGAEESTDFLL